MSKLKAMEKNAENKGRTFVCPICKHRYPVSVLELHGAVKISLYCRHCKTSSTIELKEDIR